MKNANGSCLLLLSLISSVILIYALNAWQNAVFNLDIARQKYEFEYNFRNIESLHNYGLFLYINQSGFTPSYARQEKRIPKKGNAQRVVLYKDIWPLIKSNKTENSIITLIIENNIETLQSRINNQIIECKIKKMPDDIRLELYDWKYQSL